MKYLILLLLLIPLSLFGQVESQFNGTLNIFSGYRIGSTNTFTISGIFSSTTSQYTSSQVDTGDIIQVLSGDKFYWFHVYSIASSSGGVITCNVRDSTSTRTVAPSGVVNLFRPTPNLRLPLQADGISNAAKSSVFNTLALRVDEIQTSVASAANCEQTLTKNNHGFRKWTPIYWTGSTYVRPPYDSLVPDYIVVDSLTANTFKVANCGTYATTLADGLYWFTSASPGYSLTADTVKVPLFQVIDSVLFFQPLIGFNLMANENGGINSSVLADTAAAIRNDFPASVNIGNSDLTLSSESIRALNYSTASSRIRYYNYADYKNHEIQLATTDGNTSHHTAFDSYTGSTKYAGVGSTSSVGGSSTPLGVVFNSFSKRRSSSTRSEGSLQTSQNFDRKYAVVAAAIDSNSASISAGVSVSFDSVIQSSSTKKQHFVGLAKNNYVTSPFKHMAASPSYLVQTVFGSNISNTGKFDWFRIDNLDTDTTSNRLSFYNNKYVFPNARPSSTTGRKQLIEWNAGVPSFQDRYVTDTIRGDVLLKLSDNDQFQVGKFDAPGVLNYNSTERGLWILPNYWGGTGLIESDGTNQATIEMYSDEVNIKYNSNSTSAYLSKPILENNLIKNWNAGGHTTAFTFRLNGNESTNRYLPSMGITGFTDGNRNASINMHFSAFGTQNPGLTTTTKDLYSVFLGRDSVANFIPSVIDNPTISDPTFSVSQVYGSTYMPWIKVTMPTNNTTGNGIRFYDKYDFANASPSATTGAISSLIWTAGTPSFLRSQHGVATGTTDGSGDLTVTFAAAMPDITYSLIATAEGTTYYTTTVHTKATGTVKVRFFDAAGAAVTAASVTISYEAKDY